MRISDWSSDVCSSDLVDAQHRLRGRFLGQRDFGECDTLWLMFDVELADTAVEPLRQFGAGLADAGKDDVLGRHARGQRAFQFAARNDVSAISLPSQDAQHTEEGLALTRQRERTRRLWGQRGSVRFS